MRKLIFTILMSCSLYTGGAEWQRPDCSGYDDFSECRNAVRNAYRAEKNAELKSLGLSFWYFERPDLKDEAIKQALKDKVEGLIRIGFDVEPDGKTSNVVVSYASSEEVQVYAPAFLAAIENWLFVPVEQQVTGVHWDFNLFFEQTPCEEEESSDSESEESQACNAD